MLEVKQLAKNYGKLIAVTGVSFRADRGETIGLLGPNGAGKTTTVSIIAGLLSPDSGEVLIEGKQVKSDTDPVKLKIGLVPQDMALYDKLSARDNLTFFAALYSLAGAKAKQAIDDVLSLVWRPPCFTIRKFFCSMSRPSASIRKAAMPSLKISRR
jgi:ABC-2 type transport system ATP-binding protein